MGFLSQTRESGVVLTSIDLSFHGAIVEWALLQ